MIELVIIGDLRRHITVSDGELKKNARQAAVRRGFMHVVGARVGHADCLIGVAAGLPCPGRELLSGGSGGEM